MLSDQLRKTRLAAGLTQEQVAAKARISREYVSQIERGVYHPTVEVFMRVCTAMGAKAWEVLRQVEELPTTTKSRGKRTS